MRWVLTLMSGSGASPTAPRPLRAAAVASFAGLMMAILAGCGDAPSRQTGHDWLNGSVNGRFDLVAKHLRGFDMAMVETGYRYQELYWAMEDSNWQYADYQVKKIRLAIENGIERRPKRAPSARASIFSILGLLDQAIATKDGEKTREHFATLTQQCNGCHAAEDVSFFHVEPPKVRTSSIMLNR